jgi:hypothetical protein
MSKTILRHTLIKKKIWHFCGLPYLYTFSLYENASFIIVSTIVDSLRIFNFHTDFCDMNWRYLNIALVPTGTSLQSKEIELSLPVAGYNVLVRKGHAPVMWDEWNTRSAFRTERKWKPYVWKMSYSLHEHTACSRSYSTMVISLMVGGIYKENIRSFVTHWQQTISLETIFRWLYLFFNHRLM